MRYSLMLLAATLILLQTGCESCSLSGCSGKKKNCEVDINKLYEIQVPPDVFWTYPELATFAVPTETPAVWRQQIVGKWRFDMESHIMEFRYMPGGVVISKHIRQGEKPIVGRGRYAIKNDLTIYYDFNGMRPIISPFAISPDGNSVFFIIGEEANECSEGLELVVRAERVREDFPGDGVE